MSISPRLFRKLHDTLGEEAEDLVSWMDQVESQRADFAELRQEMHAGFARLENKILEVKADLMKWSFVFWIGAVAAIATLAGVLR